ncbi:MAG: TIGR04002 family protein, partial [Eubacterium sp.]|nr:TIGR04002 family protein [Eubacterium sp.]
MKKNKVLLLTITALFTALITVSTAVIRIPIGNGYTHFGDSMIYLASCILPGPCAIFAASVGAVIVDLATGFAVYAPATAIIKALNALPFVLMRIYLKKKKKDDRILNWQIVLMLVPATLVTIFGYFIAEYIMYGQEFAFVSAVTSGWIQPVGSLAVFVILAAALDKIHFKKKIMKELPVSKRYKEIHTMKTDIVYRLGDGVYLNITN